MATVREIAHQLGLSPAAVSLAINGRPGVSEKTRRRVLALAGELGYGAPEKQEPGGSLNLVFYSPHDLPAADKDSFLFQLIAALSEHARSLRYNVRFSGINKLPSEDELRGADCVGTLFLATGLEAKELEALQRYSDPLVVIDNPCRGLSLNTVALDNTQGVYTAVDLLHRYGHSELAYHQPDHSFPTLEERCEAFRSAAARIPALAHCRDNILTFSGVPSDAGAVQGLARALEQLRRPPTAILCSNSKRAFALLGALSALGYQVPEDVSVMGFDDDPICLLANPQLTAIRAPEALLARLAVERIDAMIKGDHSVLKQSIGLDLILRDSVRDLRTSAKETN